MSLAERFLALFPGLERARGSFVPEGAREGKLRGRARTIREPTTAAHWEAHLAGREGLGVPPLRDDGTVRFAAIDVDVYGLDPTALARQVDELGLPLVVCRSKSGGAHLYLFLTEPKSAADVRVRMREAAIVLGYPAVEIFPKHDRLAGEDDVGNWINMPYFGGERKAVSAEEGELTPERFLEFAEVRAVDPGALDRWDFQGDDFPEGPPCLQHLARVGFPSGSRNNALFDCAVYAKKRWPQEWREKVKEFNEKHMSPGTPSEVEAILGSLSKKDYEYMCSQPPIVAHCVKDLCRTRKYGVGAGNGDVGVSLDHLEKLMTEPPVYYATVNGMRIELSSDDLMSQVRFAKKCIEHLDFFPARVKDNVWRGKINEMLDQATRTPAPEDATADATFRHHLAAFCLDRAQARNRREMLEGKPWPENGRTHFRSQHLCEFLAQRRFEAAPNRVWAKVKGVGGDRTSIRVDEKIVNVWWVPTPEEGEREDDR